MKWLRLYSEIKDDPKMLELDDHQFRMWIGLLCMASESGQRGVIPNCRMRGTAAALHSNEETLAEALQLFADLGMAQYDADAFTITILHWDDRQYDKPSDTRPSSHVWSLLRAAIFERDDYTCQYCGARGGRLECDHVVPVSRGGTHDLSNLVTACFTCNRSKRDKTVEEWLR